MGAPGYTLRAPLGWYSENLSLQQPFSWAEIEEPLAMEVLRRGADALTYFKIMSGWRTRLTQPRPLPSSHRHSLLDAQDIPNFTLPDLSESYTWYESRYDSEIRNEFRSLNATVKSAFGYKQKDETTHGEAIVAYKRMRAVYYQNGYTDPPEQIFKDIESADLIGIKVAGGLHRKYKEKLAKLESVLSQMPGLFQLEDVRKEMSGAGGFVPRFIAGTTSLSNHAFGLAIDIDYVWNPHIKHPAVVAVIQDVTGYDFSKPFMQRDAGIQPAEIASQTWLAQMDASRKLQEWLRKYLPIYNSSEAAELLGRKGKGKASDKNKFLTKDLPPDQMVCQEIDAPTQTELDKLSILDEHHGLRTINQWAQRGIQTIPLAFVVAMTQLGFRWGSMYENSKDIMHFELLAGVVLPAEDPKHPLMELLNVLNPADMKAKARKGSKKKKASTTKEI